MLWFNLFNENVYKATEHTVKKKRAVFSEKNLEKLIPDCVEKRKKSLDNVENLWETAKKNFEKNGVEVFFASDGQQAKNFI